VNEPAALSFVFLCTISLFFTLFLSVFMCLFVQLKIYLRIINQPVKSTQPGHPFVVKGYEYQPNGGDTLRLDSRGRCGLCLVAARTV